MIDNIKNSYIKLLHRLQVAKIHTDNKRTTISLSVKPEQTFNLRDLEKIREFNIKNTSYKFRVYNNSSVYDFKKYFKCTTELGYYLEKLTNDEMSKLKDEISKCLLVPITRNNHTCYVDSREFLCILEHKKFYHYERRKWNHLFTKININLFKRDEQIMKIPNGLFSEMNSLEIFIYNFIKSNQVKKSINFNYSMSTEELVKETSKLVKHILGFQSAYDFKPYSSEISSHPEDIVNLFNELSMKNALNYKNKLNFKLYKEIHFHLLFLILVDLNSNVKSWLAEKECTRLNTLLSNSKTTSIGFCDLFYRDKRNEASYIVELKYYRNNFKYNESLKECKLFAIDQARSYRMPSSSNEKNIECFAVVFYFDKNLIKCDLVKDNHSNKQYERISNVKVLNTKYENEIHEIENIFKIMRNKDYHNLMNHEGNEFVCLIFQNKTYLIDIEFLKKTKKEELYDESFWTKLFIQINSSTNDHMMIV
jgi:hypothetical protein